jgi:hypothetical protein
MRSVVGALVLVGMLTLTGCVDGDRLPTLPPTPTSTPIFASEEEALAAAEEAYGAYLEMSNLIANDGGAEPERIAPFVTEEQLPDELDGSKNYSDHNVHSTGATRITGVTLQQYLETDDQAEVVIYACLDVTDARLVDAGGVDVTPASRAPQVTLEVTLQSGRPGALLIADSQLWSNSDSCS